MTASLQGIVISRFAWVCIRAGRGFPGNIFKLWHGCFKWTNRVIIRVQENDLQFNNQTSSLKFQHIRFPEPIDL